MLESFKGIVGDGSEEYKLLKKLDSSLIPEHVAVIMDGNGRWAKSRGLKRVDGHKIGAESARKIAENCARLKIKYLTLFTFSSENWKRPAKEVNTLLRMLYDNLITKSSILNKNGIKLSIIGDINRLPGMLKNKLIETIDMSREFKNLNLILALNYGSRDEILNAVSGMIKDGVNPDTIDEKLFGKYLYTSDIPDPDLLIRTSGELRISNFLLYQMAYTELYFTDVLWPDFRLKELLKAIISFQKRDRRYGSV